MRLWHYKLIPHLDRQRLLGQHRECCALRGDGWGKKHATVDYVFKHAFSTLVNYHRIVMREMLGRYYNVNSMWLDNGYRGKNCKPYHSVLADLEPYPEHNAEYLQECIELLKVKNPEYYSDIEERI